MGTARRLLNQVCDLENIGMSWFRSSTFARNSGICKQRSMIGFFLAYNLQPGFLFKIGWVESFMLTKPDGER